jgi:hypothetical protein
MRRADEHTLVYRFKFDDGSAQEFRVRLDAKDFGLKAVPNAAPPSWTDLRFHQCTNCPLNPAEHPQCPAASALEDVIAFFKSAISFHEADLEIITPERTYVKRCPLQQAVSSIMGILMATSGCPVLEKFKPMVATHLPFSTTKETVYRVYSMYLLAQFFIAKEGGKPDWEMKHLLSIYEEIRTVNRCFSKRLLGVIKEDAAANALVRLDVFADHSALMLETGMMDEVKALFGAYLAGGGKTK